MVVLARQPIDLEAGRTEPVVSLPIPSGTIHAAIIAAVPPLEPPGMRAIGIGVRTYSNFRCARKGCEFRAGEAEGESSGGSR